MTWLPALIAMVVVLLIGGAVSVNISRKQQARNRTLAIITRDKQASGEKGESKDKQLAKQRDALEKRLKEASKQEASQKQDKVSIKEKMQQAGIEAPVSRFWMGSAGFAVFTLILTKFALQLGGLSVVLLTFTAFFGVPRLFLNIKAKRRQKKFLEELPDALDACVRLLQAGMPMTEAISMVSREYTGPLRDEMQRIYDNQKIGIPLGQAAYETAKRIPLTEVHMFATALQIQSETGSSLSEVLTNLSGVIRARFRLKRKIQALSQEAKSSAAIIGALPILVTFGLWCVNPKYMEPLLFTAKGHVYLWGCGIWMSLGILVMRQMINFKI
ncbi:MAG: type II secretion system F family protein [Alphaproteobacteria bacterium]|nr:type II secretion system F family protein [Alphaproteobacteria bacterium]